MSNTFNEITKLESIKRELEEAIEHEYLSDLAYTKHYRILTKRWKIICHTIRKLKRLQNG